MKAKDLIWTLLYRAGNFEAKGLFHNNNCDDYNALETMFGTGAKMIKGELEEGATYMYDYSYETFNIADVTIEELTGTKVRLTKIDE